MKRKTYLTNALLTLTFIRFYRNAECEGSLRAHLHQVIRLSIPAVLAEISSIVMQYIDAAMVGSLHTVDVCYADAGSEYTESCEYVGDPDYVRISACAAFWSCRGMGGNVRRAVCARNAVFYPVAEGKMD